MQRRGFLRNAGTLAVASAMFHTTPRQAWAASRAIRVPGDFRTIQAAVDAADVLDTILVAAGVYHEAVIITKSDLRLRAPVGGRLDRVVIRGAGGGAGIHILGSSSAPVSDVEIEGFVLEHDGIQLTNALACRLHLNEVRKIDVDFGGVTRYAIRLISSSFNEITQNLAHDCIEGILLNNASSANIVRGNRTFDLGLDPIATFACGVQVGGAPVGAIPGGANNNNLIVENEFLRTYWGIQLTSEPASTGNLVARNRCHENRRAGIGINGSSNGNFIRQNNCTGNGLEDLEPSRRFDLWDAPPVNNLWQQNQGTSNF